MIKQLRVHGIRLLADSLQASLGSLDFGTLNGCVGQPAGSDSTIVLRNRGFDTLVVAPPMVAAPFSLANPGLFPVRLLPGDSLGFTVRYAPPVRGNDAGLLLIPYQSGNCNDTLEIAITGRRDDPLLELSRSSIEIGTLTDCESGRNDSVTIYNRSDLPATVDSVRASDGVVLLRPTLPFSISPGDSLTLYVHFQPRQAGESNERLTLFSQPCGDSLTITLHGVKQGIVLGFEQSSLQFGSFLQCLLPLHDTLLATIVNTGSNGLNARVISARVVGDQTFTIDGVDNTDIPSGGSASLPVVFSPGSIGAFGATLEVVLFPCNDTLRLPLAGSVVEAKLGVEGGSFGDLLVGESSDTFVVIRNSLPMPVTVDSITNIVAPFSLDSSVPRLPALLNPGDSLVIMLRFSPTAAGTYQPTPVASVSAPCPFTVTLPLSGRGIGGGDSIGFCVSGGYQGLVGDTVTIPIDATISGPLKTPGDIRYHIRYDQQRLQLLDVISPQPVDQVPGPTPDGLLLVIHGVSELHPRQFLLRFRLLAGPDTSVVVRLDSASFGAGMAAAEICQDSARVQITARCILTGVTIGKYRNLLKPATPNPAGSTVEVTYQQLEDARAILRIWDLEGREVLRPLDAYLPGGRYTVRFSISELPSGRYFYEIQAGQYRESLGLVIQR
jgi:hypothetical protein